MAAQQEQERLLALRLEQEQQALAEEQARQRLEQERLAQERIEKERLAELEAARNEMDEYETEDLSSTSRDIIEDIFTALQWTKVEGSIAEVVKPLTEWHHRGLDDIEADWKFLSIHRADLLEAAEKYLERTWMQSKNIDVFVKGLRKTVMLK